jgi:hypothetical protein
MIKNYIKKTIVGLLMLMLTFHAEAQISVPVIWNYSVKKTAAKTYELHIAASINSGWKLYGQGVTTGFGPMTTLSFIQNPIISFDGDVQEVGKMEKYYDKNFKTELRYYSNNVDFVQKIKVKTGVATVVKGKVNYVVCNDRSCLPAKDVPFAINVIGK